METINLKTFDGIDLAADYYEAKKPIMAAVYAHMMPAAKESWRDLAEYLAQNGISGLAIKPADHQESTFDLSAAAEFLHSLGHSFKHEKIIFIGASIGANLSLQFIVKHPEYKTAILLSAGLNYHGLDAEVLVRELLLGQKVFFVACHDDVHGGSDNATQNEKLFSEVPVGVIKAKKIYERGGHGTTIFGADRGLSEEILKFINS